MPKDHRLPWDEKMTTCQQERGEGRLQEGRSRAHTDKTSRDNPLFWRDQMGVRCLWIFPCF